MIDTLPAATAAAPSDTLRTYPPTADDRASQGAGPVLAELHANEAIDAGSVHAAMRWRSDRLDWTADASTMKQPSVASSRLRAVRERIGMAAESWLVMLLVRHMSLEAIADLMSPGAEPVAAVDRARRLTIEIINRITPGSEAAELMG